MPGPRYVLGPEARAPVGAVLCPKELLNECPIDVIYPCVNRPRNLEMQPLNNSSLNGRYGRQDPADDDQ